MESQQTPWTAFGTRGSVRRLLRVHHTSNPRPYHQLQQQPGTTACVCTCKSKNRRGQKSPLIQRSGVGRSVRRGLYHCRLPYHQHLNSCCKSSGVTVRLTGAHLNAHVRNIILSARQRTETAGGLVVRTRYRCDVMIMKPIMMMMMVVMMPSDGNDDSTQLDWNLF